MKHTNIQPLTVGGGGYRSLNQDVVVTRMSAYAQRKWNCKLSSVNRDRRAMCAYVLRTGFEYQQKEIASILSVSQPVISADLQHAQFYINQFAWFRKQVQAVYDYILYNRRYIP